MSDKEERSRIFQGIYQFLVWGFLVGVVFTALVGPWVSLEVTKLYTSWGAPTYSEPDIAVDLEKYSEKHASSVLERNNITDTSSVEVYHFKVDNKADVTAQDLNIQLTLPGCILKKDMRLNQRVGIQRYRMNNITAIRTVSGNWSSFRVMSCSKHIFIDELEGNAIFHITFITTTDLRQCDVLWGPGTAGKYRVKYEWNSHGHRLEQEPTMKTFHNLQPEYKELGNELRTHNTTEYRQGNIRMVFVGLNHDYRATNVSTFNQALSHSNC